MISYQSILKKSLTSFNITKQETKTIKMILRNRITTLYLLCNSDKLLQNLNSYTYQV